MKPWVIQTLKAIKPESISATSWEQEIAQPPFAHKRLCKFFSCNWGNERLTEIFGSVIARFEEDIFIKLFKIRNLFFFFTENLAMVHGFNFTGDAPGAVCVFSPTVLLFTDTELQGAIAHELSHILLGHYQGEISETKLKLEMEDEADRQACELGFEYEIQKLRERLTPKGGFKNVLEK